MENTIPIISIIGFIILNMIYILVASIYVKSRKHSFFFIPLLVGLFVVVIMFILKISQTIKIKNELKASNGKFDKVYTCPEYWNKSIENNNIKCSSKNIYDVTSIANVVDATSGDTYKTLQYKDMNLSSIDKAHPEDKCKQMFISYYNNKKLPQTLDNKKNITWVEYHNNCLQSK